MTLSLTVSNRYHFFSLLLSLVILAVSWISPLSSDAASAGKIDRRANEALADFRANVSGGAAVLDKAKGILIMPRVIKAGIGLGGEYGEGALRIGGRTVDYYNLISGSYGFQLGAQKKAILLVFLEQGALNDFRNSQNWEVGVSASVAVIKVGAEGTIDTETLNQPVVAFVFGQKGLMYDLSLEGTKFTKIKK